MSDSPQPSTPTRVSLFVPCLSEHFDVRAVEATTRVLLHLGVTLDYPKAQTCCGQPFRTSGDLASASALAARMDKVFADADIVVTPSASCAAMLRRHIGPLSLATKVRELGEYLVETGFDPATATWPGHATYHPSCHHRDLGADHTWSILSRVRDLELAPLPNASQCCGFGGAFATKFAPVSVALGQDKLANAAVTARTLVVNDGGCRLHLRSFDSPVELKHLAEILAEGLHLMPRPPRVAA